MLVKEIAGMVVVIAVLMGAVVLLAGCDEAFYSGGVGLYDGFNAYVVGDATYYYPEPLVVGYAYEPAYDAGYYDSYDW